MSTHTPIPAAANPSDLIAAMENAIGLLREASNHMPPVTVAVPKRQVNTRMVGLGKLTEGSDVFSLFSYDDGGEKVVIPLTRKPRKERSDKGVARGPHKSKAVAAPVVVAAPRKGRGPDKAPRKERSDKGQPRADAAAPLRKQGNVKRGKTMLARNAEYMQSLADAALAVTQAIADHAASRANKVSTDEFNVTRRALKTARVTLAAKIEGLPNSAKSIT